MNNHNKFLKHLTESIDPVFKVARFIFNKGYGVKINQLTKAIKHEDWKNHVDDGDLVMIDNDKEYTIEVKKLSCSFTSSKDWSFGSKFLVCAKHSYDKYKEKPYAYFILNKGMTHAAIVNTNTYDYWTIEKRKDNRYKDITQEFYLCPLDKINWITL